MIQIGWSAHSHFIRCKLWHRQSVATDYLCQESGHWKVLIRYGSWKECSSVMVYGIMHDGLISIWKLMTLCVLAIALVHLCDTYILCICMYATNIATLEHRDVQYRKCNLLHVAPNKCFNRTEKHVHILYLYNMCWWELTQSVHFPETHSKWPPMCVHCPQGCIKWVYIHVYQQHYYLTTSENTKMKTTVKILTIIMPIRYRL